MPLLEMAGLKSAIVEKQANVADADWPGE